VQDAISIDEAAENARRNAADGFRGGLGVVACPRNEAGQDIVRLGKTQLAADLLNTLAKNFIDLNLERRYEASTYATTLLEEKLAQTKVKLERNERALIEFQRSNAIVNLDDRQTVLSSTLTDYTVAVTRSTRSGRWPRRFTNWSRPIRRRRRRSLTARRCRRSRSRKPSCSRNTSIS